MKKFKNMSLKARIFLVFLGILLLMFGSYTFTVIRFIVRFTTTQLNNDYNDLLLEISDSMQNLLWNLTLTSGQILDNDEIQDLLLNYQAASTPYVRQEYYASLMNDITMLTLANTDISLLYLYDNEDQDFIYSSYPVPESKIRELPVLYENTAFVFCGPCSSQSSYNGNPVLVLNRTETLPNGSSVMLSIESGFYSMQNLISAAQRKSAFLAITNASKELVYTNFSSDPSQLSRILADGHSANYRSISKDMSQEWTISLIIPVKIYARDYYHSLRDVLICTFFIAILVGGFALYFWKSIYSPLQLFDRQLEKLLENDFDASAMHSAIPEYDHLLGKVSSLQKQIQDMIKKIICQEQINTKIQTEKLRAQINPHFLLNTLNTMHWMALMNKQPEIDALTQALSHLLSYNLDKDSVSTNLDRELAALQEYVQLQRIRYDFHFEIIRPDEPLNYPCPKFLLQPLVENSLSHGYRPGMEIRIQIEISDRIFVTVTDTGTGVPPEITAAIEELQRTAGSRPGFADCVPAIPRFGIGLSYVISSLHDFFASDYTFHITGKALSGTAISIDMPKQKGAGYYAENTNH